MIKFIYDAEGIRKGKIVGGGEVKYLMDGLAVLCEYDGGGNIKREYVPGISMKENGKTYYYITDRLGNVRYILDENGNSIQSYTYSPFGKIHTSSGSLTQPYQYVGEHYYYTEEGIGLQLLGQRWYDVGVGRFISRDPIEEEDFNLYVYVKNNSVNWIDPEGEIAIDPHIAACIACAIMIGKDAVQYVWECVKEAKKAKCDKMEVFLDCLRRNWKNLLFPESKWERRLKNFACFMCFGGKRLKGVVVRVINFLKRFRKLPISPRPLPGYEFHFPKYLK